MRHAERLENAYWTNQFDNIANRQAHIDATGPEIWSQTDDGKNIDGFTCATGTGGTLAGTTRFLKDQSNGRVKCFLADPPGSVLFGHVQSGFKELGDRKGSSITEGLSSASLDNVRSSLKSASRYRSRPSDKQFAARYTFDGRVSSSSR